MRKFLSRKKFKQVSIVILSIGLSLVYVFQGYSMFEKALLFSKDGSNSLSVFAQTSEFLSKNLKGEEMALAPAPDVLKVLHPELRDKLIEYKSLWNATRVVLKADTTKAEIMRVRGYLIDLLKENLQIKYVVVDWVDGYAQPLFDPTVNDELMILLQTVEEFPFTLSTGWSSAVTVYTRTQYIPLFAIKFTSPPQGYATIPTNLSVQFSSNGVIIPKMNSSVSPSVGLYLPLTGAINASTQNYMTMRIKPDLSNMAINVVFYYDRDRNGVFDGYDIDYTGGRSFNQTEQGWVAGKWYSVFLLIPQHADPVVQIGIIVTGNEDGAVTLSDLYVYTETVTPTLFIDASQWLSQNLGEGEIALVPSPALFYYANVELKDKLIGYSTLWYQAGIPPSANETAEMILAVRNYTVNFLEQNSQVKFIVRDWVDSYAEPIFDAAVNDELMVLFREVQVMPSTLSGGWSRVITIYGRVHYANSFNMSFTSPPQGYSTFPDGVSIGFNSSGATIQKVSPTVSLYLVLQQGINSSVQSYLTIQIKPDMSDVSLTLVLYYDVNRNGIFDGYNTTDYVRAWTLNQADLGWKTGEWSKIIQILPKADDPIVQIAISVSGPNDGMITLANLEVFSETAS